MIWMEKLVTIEMNEMTMGHEYLTRNSSSLIPSRFGGAGREVGKPTMILWRPILDRTVTFGNPEAIIFYISVTQRTRNFYRLFLSGTELAYPLLFILRLVSREHIFYFIINYHAMAFYERRLNDN